jgi:hypothetical protein
VTNSETDSVVVPSLCMEPPEASRRQLPAMARRWGRQYAASGTFPEVELTPVEAGTLVMTESAFDLGVRPGVRLYLISELRSAVQQAVGWEHAAAVAEAFEAIYRASCWGALALVGHRGPDTVAGVRTRMEALRRYWMALDQLRYLDGPTEPISLSELVRARFAGLLAMWLRQPTGVMLTDVAAALDSMVTANAPARQDAVVAWLAKLATASPRLRNKGQLSDPTFLHQKLAELEPSEREAIELGSQGEGLALLYGLDRDLTAARH